MKKKKQTRKFTRFGRIGWKKKWRSYDDAKKFVHSLNLKNKPEWEKYSKSGKKPKDIPSAPWYVYKKEWKDWGDWLGTGTIAHQNRKFWPYEKARKFVRKLGLKSYTEWVAYRKSGKLPDYIPGNPRRTYENKGWVSYDDWLGTGTIATQIKSANFSQWPEAQQKMNKLSEEYGLKGFDDWKKFAKTHKKLLEKLNLPLNPWQVYTNEKVFNFFYSWKYLPFKEALKEYQKLAKQYGLIGIADWNKFVKTHKKLLDDLRIPASPRTVYTKENIWKRMKK